ncbi:hypothetical protein F5146DRAFT_1123944 [Armillaria mellea]|nr:hypothetical protein F5146DRAFT_1123944 [Armillaria mellea]
MVFLTLPHTSYRHWPPSARSSISKYMWFQPPHRSLSWESQPPHLFLCRVSVFVWTICIWWSQHESPTTLFEPPDDIVVMDIMDNAESFSHSDTDLQILLLYFMCMMMGNNLTQTLNPTKWDMALAKKKLRLELTAEDSRNLLYIQSIPPIATATTWLSHHNFQVSNVSTYRIKNDTRYEQMTIPKNP